MPNAITSIVWRIRLEQMIVNVFYNYFEYMMSTHQSKERSVKQVPPRTQTFVISLSQLSATICQPSMLNSSQVCFMADA